MRQCVGCGDRVAVYGGRIDAHRLRDGTLCDGGGSPATAHYVDDGPLTAIDLNAYALTEPGGEVSRWAIEGSAEYADVLYYPAAGRAGVAWGAHATWTDCTDAGDAVRRKPRVGGARVGAGRPPKPRAEKQGHNVTVWLTSEAHAQATAAAAREGQPLSDWGRAAFELALARGSTR